jgi:transposase
LDWWGALLVTLGLGTIVYGLIEHGSRGLGDPLALGARLQPDRWTPPPQVYTELRQHLVHRDGLVAARTQFRNQLHSLVQQLIVVASVRIHLESLIATLDEEIAILEQEIASALEQDEAWAAATARLATLTGLGTLTVAWILTTTINFTLTATPEAAANYAGLAPQLRQSGSSVRGRPHIVTVETHARAGRCT